MTVWRPDNAAQVREAIAWAAAEQQPLRLSGSGSKDGLGRPVEAAHHLELGSLAGVVSYEPEELVLTARPGTSLQAINEMLAQRHQELAFEPGDWSGLLGTASGSGTLGGIIACNLAGPRRIKAGAARDHFLGCSAVSGRGEIFKAGGKVVKNVTGYDLCKLLAGSYGTLAALTEVTVKVMPRAEKMRTLLLCGLGPDQSVVAMSAAAGSAHDVSGLVHLPAGVAARSSVSHVSGAAASVTAIRVEGPAPSVAHRLDALKALFGTQAALAELHSVNSAAFWGEVRDVTLLTADPGRPVWRLSVAPSEAPEILRRLEPLRPDCQLDWAGGLIWLALPAADDAHAASIRAALGGAGHATLIRAPAATRARVPVFQPLPAAHAALAARVKHSFDPQNILNPGRMG